MKQSFYTLTVAIFLMLCTACTQADIVSPVDGEGTGGDPDKGVPLAVSNVRLSLEVESRSVVTGEPPKGRRNPNPLTKIAVCVVRAGGSAKQFYDSSNPVQVFTYAGGSNSWEQSEPASPLYLFTEGGTGLAYTPANKTVEIDGSAVRMTGVSVKTAQTFRFPDTTPGGVDPANDVPWDTDQEDYLTGPGGDVDRWSPGLSLRLQHVLSKVSFRVLEANSGSLYAGSKVAKVELKSGSTGFKTSTDAWLDLSTGDLGGTILSGGTLSFTADATTRREVGTGTADAATVPVQAFGLVIPVGGVQASLELTLDDGHVFASPSFTVNWVKGRNHIYTVTLSAKGIVISNPVVAPWVEGTVPGPNVPVQ